MRRSIRAGSTSMQITTPSFMVTASGCAPPMPPSPGSQRDRASQRPGRHAGDRAGRGELLRHGREGLEGALQDALGADVDPGPGGHLAVHGQPEVLQTAELLPVGPVTDQVGVGDEHPRRPLVGAEDPDGATALHEHRLVVGERLEGPHQGVVRRPVARGLAGAAVDHELGRVLGVLGVEVVHQHPQRRLGLPRPGRQLRSAGRPDRQPGVGLVRGVHASSPIVASTVRTTSPLATRDTAAAISGAR